MINPIASLWKAVNAGRGALVCPLIATLSVLDSLPAAGDVADLTELKSIQRVLTERLDSLALQRVPIEANRVRLSTVFDSLGVSAPDSEQVSEVLHAYMKVSGRVRRVDYEMEQMTARRDSVIDALRTVYDWEISTLIRGLWEEPDHSLHQQLIIFQDERGVLGDQILYPKDMVAHDADGPDEIRRKIQLLEAKNWLLQSEERLVESKMEQLDAERRKLHARLAIFQDRELKRRADKLEDVKEQFRSLYKEQDGGFVLTLTAGN